MKIFSLVSQCLTRPPPPVLGIKCWSDLKKEVNTRIGEGVIVANHSTTRAWAESIVKCLTNITQGNKSWVGIVKGEESKGSKTLEYFPPVSGGSSPEVRLPVEVVSRAAKKWENSVVGFFVGKRLPFEVVKRFAFGKWGRMGLEKVVCNRAGYFFFIFSQGSDKSGVVGDGFTHCANHLMILQDWHLDMDLEQEPPDEIPIWAHLFNVPTFAWDEEILGRIASALGKPMFLDKITENCDRLTFARVCVAVKAAQDLPHEIRVSRGEEGKFFVVRVVYPWKPPRCATCKTFKHSGGQCPLNPKPVKAQDSKKPEVPSTGEGSRKRSVGAGKGSVGEGPEQPKAQTSPQKRPQEKKGERNEWREVGRRNRSPGCQTNKEASVPSLGGNDSNKGRSEQGNRFEALEEVAEVSSIMRERGEGSRPPDLC